MSGLQPPTLGLERLTCTIAGCGAGDISSARFATDVAANVRAGSLYVLDLEGEAEPRRLAVSDDGANTARWGSDGRLYYLSAKSGSTQLWRLDQALRTGTRVTDLPLDIAAGSRHATDSITWVPLSDEAPVVERVLMWPRWAPHALVPSFVDLVQQSWDDAST